MVLSPDTIKRQVDREGARWGLFGVIRDGECFAAANGTVSSSRGGVGRVHKDPILICVVDEQHPFSLVLAHRVKRGERDAMRRFKESEARRKKAMADQYEQYAQPFREKGRWLLDRPIRVAMPR
jgi:hypothetical protein